MNGDNCNVVGRRLKLVNVSISSLRGPPELPSPSYNRAPKTATNRRTDANLQLCLDLKKPFALRKESSDLGRSEFEQTTNSLIKFQTGRLDALCTTIIPLAWCSSGDIPPSSDKRVRTATCTKVSVQVPSDRAFQRRKGNIGSLVKPQNGQQPDPSNSYAISGVPPVSNIAELESLLELINCYGAFLQIVLRSREPFNQPLTK
ncbi:hypothetical protein CSKR_107122 [Clonorchis sinensis]|uniref:Uncharacterized protein n=1 Tax=Clonorchis sinensis TaxID=79923 RepID=A0A3R7FX05_CLOSI|nr:hypothetical protein CSKR_107122 [Clonorchis sinensis]